MGERNGLGLVIGGEVVGGGAGTYPVTNPVRPAEVVLEAPAASEGQLDTAVGAARGALPSWSALEPENRAKRVAEAAQRAQDAVETEGLAQLLTREHGKVFWEATFDAGTLAAMASAFAPLAAEATAAQTIGEGTQVQPVPQGVVAALLPFNWPVAVMGNKVLPALLTGNTVVAKAPPTCPGAVLAAVAAMAAALPPGVVNIVNGPEAALGEALVAHRDVDMVSFTGGVPTGKAVMKSAAASTTPIVLELGGNDPAVLAPDVSVDEELAGRLVEAAFVTSGQVCMAIKRLYVHEDRLDEAVDALVSRLSGEMVGDGMAEGVTMGPVHRPGARDRVESFLEEADARGAAVHRPGRVREEDRDGGGYLVSPAVVVAPPPDSAIVVEEQFAPALPVLPYRDLADAIHAANDTSFGLCASIWTNDEELGNSVAKQLEAGTVFVNSHGMSAMDYRAPMGGWKQSGFGLELGLDGMRAFTRPRVVRSHTAPNRAG